MAMSYTALKAELNTDPQTYGYAPFIASGDDSALVGLLNKPRDGTDGEVAIAVKRSDINSSEIFHAIALPDLVTSPGPAQLEYLNGLIHAGFPIRLVNEDGTDTPVRTNIIALFKPGTASLTRLGQMSTRVGSRAEQLFGVNVSANDVAIALRATA